jgi:hypothetical protein
MARDTGSAQSAASEALRNFRFHEYAPFFWILLVQLIALALAMNLGTAWGMGTMGWLARRIAGDGPVHYPVFYVFLPNLMSIIEAFLYALPGSILIPLAVLRILRSLAPEAAASSAPRGRLARAFPVVLLGAILGTALLLGWQWVLGQRAVSGTIRGLVGGGFPGVALVWVVGVLVAYALSTLLLYVPIIAVLSNRNLGVVLAQGIRTGFARFFPTFLIVLLFSLPAAIVLFVTQVLGTQLVGQIRPEITGLLVALYSVLISLASYLIYNAAVRYHVGRSQEVA